jgi:hypothetical protein
LNDIIRIWFATNEELRVIEYLCHALNVCWAKGIMTLGQNAPQAAVFIPFKIKF